MYTWLYEKVKDFLLITDEIKKIKRSKATSKKRTWKYLWDSLELALSEHKLEYHGDGFKKALTAPKKGKPTGKGKGQWSQNDGSPPAGAAGKPKGQGGKGKSPPTGKGKSTADPDDKMTDKIL